MDDSDSANLTSITSPPQYQPQEIHVRVDFQPARITVEANDATTLSPSLQVGPLTRSPRLTNVNGDRRNARNSVNSDWSSSVGAEDLGTEVLQGNSSTSHIHRFTAATVGSLSSPSRRSRRRHTSGGARSARTNPLQCEQFGLSDFSPENAVRAHSASLTESSSSGATGTRSTTQPSSSINPVLPQPQPQSPRASLEFGFPFYSPEFLARRRHTSREGDEGELVPSSTSCQSAFASDTTAAGELVEGDDEFPLHSQRTAGASDYHHQSLSSPRARNSNRNPMFGIDTRWNLSLFDYDRSDIRLQDDDDIINEDEDIALGESLAHQSMLFSSSSSSTSRRNRLLRADNSFDRPFTLPLTLEPNSTGASTSFGPSSSSFAQSTSHATLTSATLSSAAAASSSSVSSPSFTLKNNVSNTLVALSSKKKHLSTSSDRNGKKKLVPKLKSRQTRSNSSAASTTVRMPSDQCIAGSSSRQHQCDYLCALHQCKQLFNHRKRYPNLCRSQNLPTFNSSSYFFNSSLGAISPSSTTTAPASRHQEIVSIDNVEDTRDRSPLLRDEELTSDQIIAQDNDRRHKTVSHLSSSTGRIEGNKATRARHSGDVDSTDRSDDSFAASAPRSARSRSSDYSHFSNYSTSLSSRYLHNIWGNDTTMRERSPLNGEMISPSGQTNAAISSSRPFPTRSLSISGSGCEVPSSTHLSRSSLSSSATAPTSDARSSSLGRSSKKATTILREPVDRPAVLRLRDSLILNTHDNHHLSNSKRSSLKAAPALVQGSKRPVELSRAESSSHSNLLRADAHCSKMPRTMIPHGRYHTRSTEYIRHRARSFEEMMAEAADCEDSPSSTTLLADKLIGRTPDLTMDSDTADSAAVTIAIADNADSAGSAPGPSIVSPTKLLDDDIEMMDAVPQRHLLLSSGPSTTLIGGPDAARENQSTDTVGLSASSTSDDSRAPLCPSSEEIDRLESIFYRYMDSSPLLPYETLAPLLLEPSSTLSPSSASNTSDLTNSSEPRHSQAEVDRRMRLLMDRERQMLRRRWRIVNDMRLSQSRRRDRLLARRRRFLTSRSTCDRGVSTTDDEAPTKTAATTTSDAMLSEDIVSRQPIQSSSEVNNHRAVEIPGEIILETVNSVSEVETPTGLDTIRCVAPTILPPLAAEVSDGSSSSSNATIGARSRKSPGKDEEKEKVDHQSSSGSSSCTDPHAVAGEGHLTAWLSHEAGASSSFQHNDTTPVHDVSDSDDDIPSVATEPYNQDDDNIAAHIDPVVDDNILAPADESDIDVVDVDNNVVGNLIDLPVDNATVTDCSNIDPSPDNNTATNATTIAAGVNGANVTDDTPAAVETTDDDDKPAESDSASTVSTSSFNASLPSSLTVQHHDPSLSNNMPIDAEVAVANANTLADDIGSAADQDVRQAPPVVTDIDDYVGDVDNIIEREINVVSDVDSSNDESDSDIEIVAENIQNKQVRIITPKKDPTAPPEVVDLTEEGEEEVETNGGGIFPDIAFGLYRPNCQFASTSITNGATDADMPSCSYSVPPSHSVRSSCSLTVAAPTSSSSLSPRSNTSKRPRGGEKDRGSLVSGSCCSPEKSLLKDFKWKSVSKRRLVDNEEVGTSASFMNAATSAATASHPDSTNSENGESAPESEDQEKEDVPGSSTGAATAADGDSRRGRKGGKKGRRRRFDLLHMRRRRRRTTCGGNEGNSSNESSEDEEEDNTATTNIEPKRKRKRTNCAEGSGGLSMSPRTLRGPTLPVRNCEEDSSSSNSDSEIDHFVDIRSPSISPRPPPPPKSRSAIVADQPPQLSPPSMYSSQRGERRLDSPAPFNPPFLGLLRSLPNASLSRPATDSFHLGPRFFNPHDLPSISPPRSPQSNMSTADGRIQSQNHRRLFKPHDLPYLPSSPTSLSRGSRRAASQLPPFDVNVPFVDSSDSSSDGGRPIPFHFVPPSQSSAQHTTDPSPRRANAPAAALTSSSDRSRRFSFRDLSPISSPPPAILERTTSRCSAYYRPSLNTDQPLDLSGGSASSTALDRVRQYIDDQPHLSNDIIDQAIDQSDSSNQVVDQSCDDVPRSPAAPRSVTVITSDEEAEEETQEVQVNSRSGGEMSDLQPPRHRVQESAAPYVRLPDFLTDEFERPRQSPTLFDNIPPVNTAAASSSAAAAVSRTSTSHRGGCQGGDVDSVIPSTGLIFNSADSDGIDVSSSSPAASSRTSTPSAETETPGAAAAAAAAVVSSSSSSSMPPPLPPPTTTTSSTDSPTPLSTDFHAISLHEHNNECSDDDDDDSEEVAADNSNNSNRHANLLNRLCEIQPVDGESFMEEGRRRRPGRSLSNWVEARPWLIQRQRHIDARRPRLPPEHDYATRSTNRPTRLAALPNTYAANSPSSANHLDDYDIVPASVPASRPTLRAASPTLSRILTTLRENAQRFRHQNHPPSSTSRTVSAQHQDELPDEPDHDNDEGREISTDVSAAAAATTSSVNSGQTLGVGEVQSNTNPNPWHSFDQLQPASGGASATTTSSTSQSPDTNSTFDLIEPLRPRRRQPTSSLLSPWANDQSENLNSASPLSSGSESSFITGLIQPRVSSTAVASSSDVNLLSSFFSGRLPIPVGHSPSVTSGVRRLLDRHRDRPLSHLDFLRPVIRSNSSETFTEPSTADIGPTSTSSTSSSSSSSTSSSLATTNLPLHHPTSINSWLSLNPRPAAPFTPDPSGK